MSSLKLRVPSHNCWALAQDDFSDLYQALELRDPSLKVGKITEETVMLSILEMGIVYAIACGFHDSEIARELGLSEVAVQDHLQEIMSKLEVTSRVELIFLVHMDNSPITLDRRAA